MDLTLKNRVIKFLVDIAKDNDADLFDSLKDANLKISDISSLVDEQSLINEVDILRFTLKDNGYFINREKSRGARRQAFLQMILTGKSFVLPHSINSEV
jgi:hypothetical protein